MQEVAQLSQFDEELYKVDHYRSGRRERLMVEEREVDGRERLMVEEREVDGRRERG